MRAIGLAIGLRCDFGGDLGVYDMRKIWLAAAAIGLTASVPAAAQADSALSQCLIAKTSPADRLLLVKWIFAVISASPQVKDLSTVTAAQRDALSKQAGGIFNRLVTADCRSQAVESLKQNGDTALEKAFGTLGEYSMEGLVKDPAVGNAMIGLLAGVDVTEWAKVQIEADIPFGSRTRK